MKEKITPGHNYDTVWESVGISDGALLDITNRFCKSPIGRFSITQAIRLYWLAGEPDDLGPDMLTIENDGYPLGTAYPENNDVFWKLLRHAEEIRNA